MIRRCRERRRAKAETASGGSKNSKPTVKPRIKRGGSSGRAMTRSKLLLPAPLPRGPDERAGRPYGGPPRQVSDAVGDGQRRPRTPTGRHARATRPGRQTLATAIVALPGDGGLQ